MKIENTAKSALFIAVGVLLPYITAHAFGVAGTVLLPMHIPVLLSGLLLGYKSGLTVGVITPVVSFLLTGMPAAYPMLPIMLFELGTYGFVSGFVSEKTCAFKKLGVYISMLCAMLCGRMSYAAVFYILLLNNPDLKALSVWGAVTAGVFGIIIQIVFIPSVVFLLWNTSKGCVLSQKYDCVINTASGKRLKLHGSGVKPLLQASAEDLNGAKVYDKIIGKAAAMLCVAGGVKKVYGNVMSKPAKDYLEKHGVSYSYHKLTDRIQNRARDGLCPIESCVMDIEDAAQGAAVIKETIKTLMGAVNA